MYEASSTPLDHTSFFFVNSLSFYNCVNSACYFILQEPQCGVTFQICCTAWCVNWNYGKGHFHVIPWQQAARFNIFNTVKSRWMTICKFENDVVLLGDLY